MMIIHLGHLDKDHPQAPSSCPYGITPHELNEINGEKNMTGLQKWGGVAGIASQLHSDAHHGLTTTKGGLSAPQEHATWFGKNKFQAVPPKHLFYFLWENMQDPIIILLVVAALVSMILGSAMESECMQRQWIEGAAILVAVILVTMVGAYNDYKKDLQFGELDAQKDILDVKVVRDGQEQLVKSLDIVVGDVLFLDTGDKVIADGILIHTNGLIIDEASLTGELGPIKKNHEDDPWCRSGTQVTEGSGHILVSAVGPNSEWGKILGRYSEAGSDGTPLQEKLGHLAGVIGKIGFVVAIAIFFVLLFKWCVSNKGFSIKRINDNGPVQFFLYCVTIMAVSIPEGLPLAVTISLAYSMRKMMKDNNFVRVLAACETMGEATTICSDKTGMLTENRMTVAEGWFGGTKLSHVPALVELRPQLLTDIEMNIALNSKAFLVEKANSDVEFVGNRTECALLMLMRAWGHSYKQMRGENESKVIKLYGFSSEKKMASVLVQMPDRMRLYSKGAAASVLKRCTRLINEHGDTVEMTENIRQEMLQNVVVEMASRGLRCICMTYTDFFDDPDRPADFFEECPDNNLVACAIVGIKDSVRKEVSAAVASCQKAGIMVRMVTGDNIHTAKHIARECGILTDDGIALEGPVFRNMMATDLLPMLDKLQVLACSSPKDKFDLVQLLKQQGEVVAVTGDGTNDAPALKASDVGLAMGIAGTEVAKEAADIVILDDSFSSTVKAMLWGRSVFKNIRKLLMFQLTANFVALLICFTGAVVGGIMPFNVLQLLWVNLIMDVLGTLGLTTEEPNMELLDDKPYGRNEPLINMIMWKHILVQGSYQMFWMFFCLYALPIAWKDRYGITKECDWWSQRTTFGGQELSRCEEHLIRHDKFTPGNALATCIDLTSCNLKHNACGFPSLHALGTCSLNSWWRHQPYPRNLQGAYCGNGTAGCPLHNEADLNVNHGMIHSAIKMLDNGYQEAKEKSQERSLSVLFNLFIFAQVANAINARRINDEYNVFQNLHHSPIFISVVVFIISGQAIIINFLGLFFKVVPLKWDEWLVTMALGFASIPVSLLTRYISNLMRGKEIHFCGKKGSRLPAMKPETLPAPGNAEQNSAVITRQGTPAIPNRVSGNMAAAGTAGLFDDIIEVLPDLIAEAVKQIIASAPLAKPLAAAVKGLYTSTQQVCTNVGNCKELRSFVDDCILVLHDAVKANRNALNMHPVAIRKFIAAIEDANALVVQFGSRHWVHRLVRNHRDAEELQEKRDNIEDALKMISLSAAFTRVEYQPDPALAALLKELEELGHGDIGRAIADLTHLELQSILQRHLLT